MRNDEHTCLIIALRSDGMNYIVEHLEWPDGQKPLTYGDIKMPTLCVNASKGQL